LLYHKSLENNKKKEYKQHPAENLIKGRSNLYICREADVKLHIRDLTAASTLTVKAVCPWMMGLTSSYGNRNEDLNANIQV